jgi:nucleoside-diphosphate-sugar epimerase
MIKEQEFYCLKVKKNNMKKRILVTGGYGFLAGYVVEELKRQGFQPVVTVRHDEPSEILKDCIVYKADMTDEASIYAAVEHSDGVIHLAGLLGTSENIRQAKIMNHVNIDGALNVLNAVDNFNIPAVLIGVGNYFEFNTYSISKTTAEKYAIMYARNFGTRVNVVRALNAVGARQKWGKINKILPTFINKALRNEDISVYGGKDKCSLMDMIYAGDVAKILIDVLKRTDAGEIKGEIFEAGTGIGYPVYEIAEKIIKACDSKSKIIEVPMRAGESEKAAVIAQNPYPIEYKDFDSILVEAVDYYRDLMSNE